MLAAFVQRHSDRKEIEISIFVLGIRMGMTKNVNISMIFFFFGNSILICSLLGLNGVREESPSKFLMDLASMRPFFKKINGIDILSITKE